MPFGELSPTTTAASPTGSSCCGASPTSFMVRNIPTRYTASTLLEVFDQRGGFSKTLDFMYLPMDFKTKKNVGYAFVNFAESDAARNFVACFQGAQLKASTSLKRLDITPSRRQGFIPNISVFGASDLLRGSKGGFPGFKPLVLVHGQMVPLTDTLYEELLKGAITANTDFFNESKI